MSSDYDPTEFVDGDFQAHKSPYSATPEGAGQPQRAPTREEVAADLARKQQELAAIIREKEEKERERAALEETRRRQMEFHTGREEMLQSLTRGLGLLEEAEFSARRDAEQMAKALADLRDALAKIQAVHEETWTTATFSTELTRALTAVENARMEWNSARLKLPILSGVIPEGTELQGGMASPLFPAKASWWQLCKIGLALTWPLLLAIGALAAVLAVALLRR